MHKMQFLYKQLILFQSFDEEMKYHSFYKIFRYEKFNITWILDLNLQALERIYIARIVKFELSNVDQWGKLKDDVCQ